MPRSETEARAGIENLRRLRELIAEARNPWKAPSMQRLVERLKLSMKRTGVL